MADAITALAENLKKTGPQHDAKVNSMPYCCDHAAQVPAVCTEQAEKISNTQP